MSDFWAQFIRSTAIAKKDMLIFYLKGPVVIMGLLFPFFMFGAFLIGRNLSSEILFVALVSMTAFFTSAAVGPTIIPWEARSKTLERLMSSPISITTVLLGDMQASFYFGLFITSAISLLVLFLPISLNLLIFIPAVLLSLFTFSAMTILMSSYPPTDIPADVMMLSSLVKFSLLFVSGIFVPVDKLPDYARPVTYISPLTYLVDSLRYSAGLEGFFPLWVNFLALALFGIFFFLIGVAIHKRVLEKRFM